MAAVGEVQVIEQRLKELAALVEQREQIQTRILKLEVAVRAFIELLADKKTQQAFTTKLEIASKPMGLTEVVKGVLRSSGTRVPATAVKKQIVASGFPLTGYVNALAAIYTTLNRLQEQALVDRTAEGYMWIGPPDSALKIAWDWRKRAKRRLA